jgi:hypothetical protein
MMNRLPTYIIAGAMRSGTTALNSYLREHPDVAVSSRKEVHFFDSFYDRGVEWYREQFPGSEAAHAVGEATPNYMFSTTALDRIRETLPDVKLVVMLRNPIDRAYSHYWHDRARGKTHGDFAENVKQELEDPDQQLNYIARGRYRTQIEEILRRFPASALHVEIFEDMVDRPADLYSSVCRFIGVDPGFRPDGLGAPVNNFIEFRSLAVRRASRNLPGRLQDMIGRVNTKRKETYPPMPTRLRNRLADEFATANSGLEELIGRSLSWDAASTPPAKS